MHSIVYTGRLLSRAIWNGITNYTTSSAEASVSRKREPHLVHAVCGFPKDFTHPVLKKGQFGDDAWFHAWNKNTDVIGKLMFENVGLWLANGDSSLSDNENAVVFLVFHNTRSYHFNGIPL